MCKNVIVSELYCSKEFNDCISNMQMEHLRDDLKAEVALILLQTDETKLIGIHERGELKYYVVRIILNLIKRSRSDFNKKFRLPVSELTDRFTAPPEPDFEERAAREDKEDRALGEIDNLYWYDKTVLQLYMTHGNYRAIEKETRIPYSSTYKTIRKSIEHIKQKVR